MADYRDFMGRELKIGDFVVSGPRSSSLVGLNLYKVVKFTARQVRIQPIAKSSIPNRMLSFCRRAEILCKVREEDVTMYILKMSQTL